MILYRKLYTQGVFTRGWRNHFALNSYICKSEVFGFSKQTAHTGNFIPVAQLLQFCRIYVQKRLKSK